MLRALNIRDFVIVDRVDLEFSGGFTVLSGETGAGKSILIDALAMVLGERSDAGIVRQGAEKAEISAEFEIAALQPLQRWLTENDLAGDDDVCLVRRVVDSGGRSRAFINGRGVTLAQLREAGECLVDIHGQHEHQSLLRAPAQRALLDAYAGLDDVVDAVAAAWRNWQGMRQQLVLLETNATAFDAEREQLEWQVRELDALNFSLNEWQELQAEHGRLAHAQSLIEGAQYAMDALSEGDNSSVTQLVAVLSRLDRLLEYDPRLKEIVGIVASAQAQAQEAVYMLRDYQQHLDLDPQRFKQVEQRLDAVHTSARKYRATPETLPETLARAQARLDQMGGSGDIETMRKRETESHAAYLAEAKKLSAGRKKAAKKLSEKVTESMQTLALVGSSFEVALNPLEEGSLHGSNRLNSWCRRIRALHRGPLRKSLQAASCRTSASQSRP